VAACCLATLPNTRPPDNQIVKWFASLGGMGLCLALFILFGIRSLRKSRWAGDVPAFIFSVVGLAVLAYIVFKPYP
jgi:hypothetical protein